MYIGETNKNLFYTLQGHTNNSKNAKQFKIILIEYISILKHNIDYFYPPIGHLES